MSDKALNVQISIDELAKLKPEGQVIKGRRKHNRIIE